MTKREIAQRIHEELSERGDVSLSKRDVHNIVKDTFDIIMSTLHGKEKVQISGFGTFVVKKRKGKVGRNLRTGETIKVPDRYVVLFRPSKKLVSYLTASKKSV